ncbi:MAG TPA: Gfo/Idh/MocA family oxidoreductase, partial [Alphaproteobacteria bacterium]|nr:Gfo/Idh/MocA family oxidoreductase [Alphaproteobacteria bacterium]
LTGCLPSSVRTTAAAPRKDAPPQQVTLLLTFPGGISADISLSAIHPVKLHQITVAGTEAYGVFEDSLGWDEKVMIIRPGLEDPKQGAEAPHREAITLAPAEPLRLEIEAFLAAMGGGPPPASGPEEALEVVQVLAAAEQSLDTGLTVNP